MKELTKLFRRSKQALYQSNVLDNIKKSYPFGQKYPLFDITDVENWNMRLIRFDGFVALGLAQGVGRGNLLQDAPTIEVNDSVCPRCSSFAIHEPASNRFWCPNCKLIHMSE
ncbi:MAG: hypothetical protein HYR87_07775 [Thaumarchaeota archaeon]|nr:hypothetical protein [Nitrososphaerota archaeon]